MTWYRLEVFVGSSLYILDNEDYYISICAYDLHNFVESGHKCGSSSCGSYMCAT